MQTLNKTFSLPCTNNPDTPLDIRVTYVGCNFIRLPNIGRPGNILNHPLIQNDTASSQAIVECNIQGTTKYFYINKRERYIQEVNLPRKISLPDIEDYQAVALTLDVIDSLSNTPGLYQLSVNARKVINIEAHLTPEQRRQALLQLDDSNINHYSTAYTYIFQGFLARYMGQSLRDRQALVRKIQAEEESAKPVVNKGFFTKVRSYLTESSQAKLDKMDAMREFAEQLHGLSTHFKGLEEFVNNTSGSPKLTLMKFEDAFNMYQTSILANIDEIIRKIDPNDIKAEQKKKILTKLRADISKSSAKYAAQIAKLKLNPRYDEVDCLLSIADRSFFIKSLGSLMQEQMSSILDAGIKVSYKISNQRLKDVIQVPRLVAFLSDAEHLMLIKGESVVDGPKDNDTYSPIPREMIDAITGSEVINDDDRKWFGLTPYIKKSHPAYIDEVLCILTGEHTGDNNLHGNKFYHFVFQPLKLIASVVEIAFSVPRLILVVGLGVVEAGIRALPFYKSANTETITTKINHYLLRFYRDFAIVLAPLSYMHNLEFNRYKRNDFEKNMQHQAVLDECGEYSSYCHILFNYVTPQLIAGYIQDFFTSIFGAIVKFFDDIKYLLAPASAADEVYIEVQKRHKAAKILEKVFNAKSPEKLIGPRQFDKSEAEAIKSEYANVKYCHNNNIKSPLDVFYEIAVVISNDVVNPMFRKSPAIATFYFALSMLTFGTFVLPTSTFAWMKPVPIWLQYLANRISIHFTGKAASVGVLEQSIACFLGWKLGFFSTEFVVEMLEGHYEILKKLFEDPEQIVLGLVGLVGVGMSLQYIPELPSMIKLPGLPALPNPYFIIINTFTEEAKSCADGTFGLTSIEYGFLGLKFGMLFHSMLAGSEKESEKFNATEKLAFALQNEDFLKSIVQVCKDNSVAPSVDGKTDYDKLSADIGATITAETTRQGLKVPPELVIDFKNLLLQEIKSGQEFLNSEEFQSARQVVEKSTKKQQPKPQPSLTEATQALRDAIAMTLDKKQKLLLAPAVFGVNTESHQMYDKLDRLFDEYNAALRREKSHDEAQDLFIDKRPYLDVFFNKYCYKSSNNFIRSMLIIFYPLPVISRSLKYLWATITNKPSMQHQVVKNFSKDFVILSQVITPFARMTADFALYVSGVLRGAAYLTVLPVAGLIVYPLVEFSSWLRKGDAYKRVPFSAWFEVIDDFICKYIALHKTPAFQPLRRLIVSAARIAGNNTDLASVAEKVGRQLSHVAEVIDAVEETAEVGGVLNADPNRYDKTKSTGFVSGEQGTFSSDTRIRGETDDSTLYAFGN